MSDDELTPEQAAAITAAVDIEAAPPDGQPVALVLFGTNQAAPARIAAERYHGVVREFQEVPRRVADGSYRAARKADSAWRLS